MKMTGKLNRVVYKKNIANPNYPYSSVLGVKADIDLNVELTKNATIIDKNWSFIEFTAAYSHSLPKFLIFERKIR